MKFNKLQIALIAAGLAIGLSAIIMRKMNYIDGKSEYAIAFLTYERLSMMFVGAAFVIDKKTIRKITGAVLMLFSAAWIVFLVRLYWSTKP
jgi:hypothetical protein